MKLWLEIRPNDVLLNDIFVVCMDWIGFEKFAKVKKVLQLAPVSPTVITLWLTIRIDHTIA